MGVKSLHDLVTMCRAVALPTAAVISSFANPADDVRPVADHCARVLASLLIALEGWISSVGGWRISDYDHLLLREHNHFDSDRRRLLHHHLLGEHLLGHGWSGAPRWSYHYWFSLSHLNIAAHRRLLFFCHF